MLKRGVPQGAVLSPTLWIIFMYDFPKPISSCCTSLFADDIEFHTSSDSPAAARSILQPYLNRISTWASTWGLNFSVDKCAVLVFTRKRLPINFDLNFCNKPISTVTNFIFLGLFFDKALNWKIHITHTIPKAFRVLSVIKYFSHRKKVLCFKTLIQLYKALVCSRLDAHNSNVARNPIERNLTARATKISYDRDNITSERVRYVKMDLRAEEESEKISMSCLSNGYSSSKAFFIAISFAVNTLVDEARDQDFEIFRAGI